jgi:DNA-binding transcriptional ArsR family regulator
MQTENAAGVFAELGNVSRLEVMRLLIKAGRDGMSIGDIQAHLGIPASTLSFHLRGRAGAGLVEQEKQGRTVICRTCRDRVNEAIAFLKAECCVGVVQPARRRKKVA